MKKILLVIVVIINFTNLEAIQKKWDKDYNYLISVAYSYDGTKVLACSREGASIRREIIDSQTGQIKFSDRDSVNTIISPDFSLTLKYDDTLLVIFDTYTKSELYRIKNLVESDTFSCKYYIAPDNQILIKTTNYIDSNFHSKYNREFTKFEFINISDGEILSSFISFNGDTIGLNYQIIFDRGLKDVIYFQGRLLELDEKDSAFYRNKLFQYNLKDESHNVIFSNKYEKKINSWVNITSATNPTGCLFLSAGGGYYFRTNPDLLRVHKIVAPDSIDLKYKFNLWIVDLLNDSTYLMQYRRLGPIPGTNYFSLITVNPNDNIVSLLWENMTVFDSLQPGMTYESANPNHTMLIIGSIHELNCYDLGGTTEVEQNNHNTLSIFPNPASDYIEINMPSRPPGEDIRIFDLLGTVIQSTPVSSADTPAGGGHVRIDVSSLQPGVYFARMVDFVRKFVKI